MRLLLVIPHITDAIMAWVKEVSKKPVTGTTEEPDICIVEVRRLPGAQRAVARARLVLMDAVRCSRLAVRQLGGTVGDIESAPFVEAMRQFQFQVGHENFCLVRCGPTSRRTAMLPTLTARGCRMRASP